MLLIPSRGVMFVAVPKTGSTAVRNSLWAGFGGVTSFTPEQMEAMRLNEGHSTLAEFANVADGKVFDLQQYPRRFAVVRNPYDRAVSLAAWLVPNLFADDPGAAIRGALWDRGVQSRAQSSYHDPSVRFIKYENLYTEYFNIVGEWGLEDAAPLEVENESQRNRDYRVYLDDKTKAVIEQRYSLDFDIFGYNRE